MLQIVIKKEEINQEIKAFLIQNLKDISSSKIAKSLKNGDIKVNKKKVAWNYKLQENDIIQIFLRVKNPKEKENLDFLNSNPILSIFYEDQNIIVVNKPRGVLCQPDMNQKIDTLNNRIKKYLYEKNDKSYQNANLCHRLDKYTSGLCIAAKNFQTLKELNSLWNSDVIQKYYLCLCFGKFQKKSEILTNYIFFDEQNQIMKIDTEKKYNKKIVTHYKVLEQNKDYALLEILLLTGKKHQIRVHMSSIGHPILGDTKYNKLNNYGFKYPCLVSYKFKFNFPKNHYLAYLNRIKLQLKNTKFK